MTVNQVEGHLLQKGMRTDYTKWIYHGEVDEDEEDDDEGPELGDDNMEEDNGDDGDMGEDNDMGEDDMLGVLNDLMAPLANPEEPNAQAQNLYKRPNHRCTRDVLRMCQDCHSSQSL
ncbi:unnamed protein product [Linum tenue]|uniref:Transposase-associated domain-containing protein n=1 Tax=Linum tenue TaxID=586396 RepID=A0AAV0LIN8_9ROSI|nr:unnamed protein product [Linum tenue]CAI0433486.1 unnamed protein product [Linum tenue]